MKSALWAYASIATLTFGFLGGCGSDDENTSAKNCAISCGTHGSCNTKTGACECEMGFSGTDCNECAAGFYPQGNACVADQCKINSDCEDGVACNGHETCEGGFCRAAAPVMCGNGSCMEPYGECACEAGYHFAGTGCLLDECTTDAQCSNGLVCDGDERCIANTCQVGAPVSCGSHGTCQEPGATCTCDDGYHLSGTQCLKDTCTSNEECDDGLVCNGEETCVGGSCENGTAVSCVENEECVEPDGTCACAPGYIDDGGTCVEALAIIGSWTDEADYAHEITQTEWTMDTSIFHISQFDNAGEFLVAHNDAANTYFPDLWSRFDWTYDAADLYYCQTAYDAADEATAAAETSADRADLDAGCAGFAWSPLTPVTTTP